MRFRAKKWVVPELSACPYFIDDPENHRGGWARLFPEEKPLHIEFGCGKCVSTAQMAYANPDVNYIAVDLSSNVLGVARRNIQAVYGEKPVNNLIITHFNIMWAEQFVAPEDVTERIYISFCNPWNQRPGQYKRRLTHTRQLRQYRQFMASGAEIYFKTDDTMLFKASLEYFKESGFSIEYLTDDLHASGFTPNYVSEHEKMYTDQGVPIHFAIAKKQETPSL